MTFLSEALPRPMAFVLGGGASSAAAQIGVLRALAECGVAPDLIVGTSAGALNGAVLADDPDGGLVRLGTIWATMKRRAVVADSALQRMRNLASRRHLYSDVGLRRLFMRHISAASFDQLTVRFACVATDLKLGRPAILESGDLLSALLATSAIPGVFPRVHRDGRDLVDGLCVANVPTRQALELGARSLVVVAGRPGMAPVGPRSDVRDVVSSAFAAALMQQAATDLTHARERVPVLEMPAQPAERLAAFDFTRTSDIIAHAYQAARDYLFRLGPALDGRQLTPSSAPTAS